MHSPTRSTDLPAHTPAAAPACSPCCASEAPCAAPPLPPNEPDAGAPRFYVPDMDCISEEREIRHALAPIAGISQLSFDIPRREVAIAAQDAAVLAQALAAMRAAGFAAQPRPTATSADAAAAALASAPNSPWRVWAKPGLALALALLAEGLHFVGESGSAWAQGARFAGMAVSLAAIALSGLGVYRKGLAALRMGRLNINALMAVAVTGAFLIGQWPEAAMVMALYAIAELLEARAVARARGAIAGVLALAPDVAEVQQADGSWQTQAVASVAQGAVLRVKPGERIALDGVVLAGHSSVDQSPVTGESLPVDKTVGDAVYAGTLNQAGALDYRASTGAEGSTLARIAQAVQRAEASRAPMERTVDRLAAVYTPAVFVLAVGVALAGPLVLGWTWLHGLYTALVLLVIACPCALVIATPVTVVSALTAAARRGVLIKGGADLENARRIRAVALDKTGTLTLGKPKLVAFEGLAAGAAQHELERLALSLAQRSDHPVAQAIAAGLPAHPTEEVHRFTALAGRGVQGEIAGRRVVLANARWAREAGVLSEAAEARLQTHEQAGCSVSLLAFAAEDAGDSSGAGASLLALAAVADTLRGSSAHAVKALAERGIATIMLTGDGAGAAQHMAAQAGIAEVRAGLLPQDKLTAIAELQQRIGPTAMAGDGINDAPALAQADIGFAMGSAGTHTAMEAADVVVMGDDLRQLPFVVDLSARTHRVLWQNIALALGIKAVFFVLALAGSATLWMAVLADVGASLLVVANGLRMLNAPAGPPSHPESH